MVLCRHDYLSILLCFIFSKHVFDKMLETLVKSRASAYPPPRLFSPVHDTFCTAGETIHTVNQVEEKEERTKKSTPTRRAFWQALVRTAKRPESEYRSGVEANMQHALHSSLLFSFESVGGACIKNCHQFFCHPHPHHSFNFITRWTLSGKGLYSGVPKRGSINPPLRE